MRYGQVGIVALTMLLGCSPTESEDDTATTNADSGAGTGPAGTGTDADASTGAGDTRADGTDASDASTAGSDPCEGPDPAPGCPGGLCLGPDGTCNEVTCNLEANYCYDPDDPCAGFACGGADRGACSPVDGLPACVCNEGFENETFSLYCCPVDGGDDVCI